MKKSRKSLGDTTVVTTKTGLTRFTNKEELEKHLANLVRPKTRERRDKSIV